MRNELIFSVVKSFDANISHFGNFVLTAKNSNGRETYCHRIEITVKPFYFVLKLKVFSIIVKFCLVIKTSFRNAQQNTQLRSGWLTFHVVHQHMILENFLKNGMKLSKFWAWDFAPLDPPLELQYFLCLTKSVGDQHRKNVEHAPIIAPSISLQFSKFLFAVFSLVLTPLELASPGSTPSVIL